MTTTLVRDNLHHDLVRACIGSPFLEADALLWMVLLHTHQIRMRPGTAKGGNGKQLLVFPAVTQRHAAEVVAELWSELYPEDSQRSGYPYWYHAFNNRTPYEVSDDVPAEFLPRFSQLRAALASDPRVAEVVPEE